MLTNISTLQKFSKKRPVKLYYSESELVDEKYTSYIPTQIINHIINGDSWNWFSLNLNDMHNKLHQPVTLSENNISFVDWRCATCK